MTGVSQLGRVGSQGGSMGPASDQAFGRLIQDNQMRMLRTLYKSRPYLSWEDCVDAYQEATFSVYKHWNEYGSRPLDEQRKLLYVAMVNKAENIRRGERRRRDREDRFHEIHMLGACRAPEQAIIAREWLTEILAPFELGRRELVLLRIHEYTAQEVAAMLDISVRTVWDTMTEFRRVLSATDEGAEYLHRRAQENAFNDESGE